MMSKECQKIGLFGPKEELVQDESRNLDILRHRDIFKDLSKWDSLNSYQNNNDND